jgi:hypothetical protein
MRYEPAVPPAVRFVAMFLLAACGACKHTPPSPSVPERLEGVLVARCASVVRGPVCRLGSDRSLSVFVPGGSCDLDVTVDARSVAKADTSGEDGRRFDVTVPPGAARLGVSARVRVGANRRTFDVALTDAPAPPSWLEDARSKKERGAFDEAERVLDDAVKAPDAGDDGYAVDVASFRARVHLARGESERAADELASSAERHAERGEVSQAADDLGARAYVLITGLRRDAEARATIARLASFSPDYPEAGALASYYAGLVASETGDPAAALAKLGDARARAERLAVGKITRSVTQLYALSLLSLGRAPEAYDALATLEREQGASMSPCERGSLVLNLGWTALIAGEAPYQAGHAPPDPLSSLQDAVATFSGPCRNPQQQAIALDNLARGQLHAGDPAAARASLEGARAASAHPRPLLAFAELETEGRIALADRDGRAALRAYDALAEAAAGVSRLDEEAALEERAGALALLKDRAGAIAAARRADAMLDEAARAIPTGEGRGAFWWTRARVARTLVQWLIDAGRPDEALDAARASRARIARDVQRTARTESLPPEARARWEDALAEYRRARDAIVSEAADDWSLSESALAVKVAERRARDVAARAHLDGVVRAVLPSSEPRLPPVPAVAGVVDLTFVPLEGAWAVLSVDGGKASVATTPDVPSAEQVASALLAAVGDRVASARRLRLRPFGVLRDVDWSALPVRGRPLVAIAPIEYPLDAADLADDAPGASPLLVVADPTGTLPAARREGDVVAAIEAGDAGVRLLAGADATRARVLEGLPRASALHFAGHASYAGVDGWESALLLAGGERVTVADVLALPRVPARVVLSGCETGIEGEQGGGPPGLGLADAFIAAGSAAVVASTRRVDDASADLFMRALAAALARTPDDVPLALQRAQLDARSALPSTEWSAFRAFVR